MNCLARIEWISKPAKQSNHHPLHNLLRMKKKKPWIPLELHSSLAEDDLIFLLRIMNFVLLILKDDDALLWNRKKTFFFAWFNLFSRIYKNTFVIKWADESERMLAASSNRQIGRGWHQIWASNSSGILIWFVDVRQRCYPNKLFLLPPSFTLRISISPLLSLSIPPSWQWKCKL